jgi:hypothetical protein
MKESGMENSLKKTAFFGQIEDIISIGALLRPMIVKAVSELKSADLEEFRGKLIDAEKELANTRVIFAQRFENAQDKLRATYAYAPIWRFIGMRVEDAWKNSTGLTVKELSVVSLLFGIMLEEVQTRISFSKKTKRSA